MGQSTSAEMRRRLVAAAPSGARFGFQGLRASDCIAVEPCLPLEFLVACDWGLDGPAWDARLRFFSVERGGRRRIVWTHSAIVSAFDGPWGAALRDYLAEPDRVSLIVPYRSTEFLEAISEASGGRVAILANPHSLKARLDDKVAFRQEGARRKVAVPPGEIVAVGELEDILLSRWGPRLVVTEQVGSSGNQTHLIERREALWALRAHLTEKLGPDAPLLANPFLAGPSVGATAFIAGGKARMSHPSVMVNGLAGCSMHRFDYAGSDYAAYGRLPENVRRQIEAATLTMGDWVAGLGYRGIFGMDFVVEGGTAFALELNPRLLGTTQLLTELEGRAGTDLPSAYWHLAEFLGVSAPEQELASRTAELAARPPSGYQLLLRNTRAQRVRAGRSLKPGVYDMVSGSPQFFREGDRISALEAPEEVLLTCSPPEKGTVVEPRGVFFKLEGVGTLYDEGVEALRPAVSRMVDIFTRGLDLRAADQTGD